jgi:choline kinase
MRSITRAIMLIAGRGKRAGVYTQHKPKCLVEIAYISILKRSLLSLSACGIHEIVFVVGYKADQIRQYVINNFSDMQVEYVLNPIYDKTNTAYSLWLAREYLKEDCLILEGDILFDMDVLQQILDHGTPHSIWAAKPIPQAEPEGILLSADENGLISHLKLVRSAEQLTPNLNYKCAGIQLLTGGLAEALADRLDQVIGRGEHQVYADLVLGELIEEHPMTLCSLNGLRWAEVDDEMDIVKAQSLFSQNHFPEKKEEA